MKRLVLILTALTLFAFKTRDNKSEYNVPLCAWQVIATDIDLDNQKDIIVGNKFNTRYDWGGWSILKNFNNGFFQLYDSIYMENGFQYVCEGYFDKNLYPEIFGRYVVSSEGSQKQYIGIFYNYGLLQNDSLGSYLIDCEETVRQFTSGDINGDGNNDIVLASHIGKKWGVFYNSGNGSFNNVDYYNVSDYNPSDLACGDLNNDGRDDIIICGSKTEIYFSYPDGFQQYVLETEDFLSAIFITDFNLDGYNDIVAFDNIIGVFTPIFMYRNIDGTNFERLPTIVKQPGADEYFITDFNNDTLPDILLQLFNYSGYLLYYNEGNFQLRDSLFIPVSYYDEGWRHCYCADLDGNNYQDIITTRCINAFLPANVDIKFNDGNGNFVDDPITEINNSQKVSCRYFLSCYPNPFTNTTLITYQLFTEGKVSIDIFDNTGRKLKSYDQGYKETGNHTFEISGEGLNPGIYFYSICFKGQLVETKKMSIF